MASIDASGYAKSAAAMAAGVERLGHGMASLGSSVQGVQNANDDVEKAKFNAQWTNEKLDAAAGLKAPGGSSSVGASSVSAPADTVDPFNPPAAAEPDAPAPQADAPQDVAPQDAVVPGGINPPAVAGGNPDIDAKVQAYRAQRDQYLQGVSNPKQRELLSLNSEDDITRIRIGLQKQASAADRDRNLAYARDHQDAIISRSIESDDPQARADAIDSQMGLINSYASKGYLTQQQAAAWKGAFKNKYAESFALAAERKGPDAVSKTISELEQASLNAAVPPTPPKPSSDKRSAISSPMDVAKTFLGKEEHADNQILASFIQKSAGKKVDPAQTAWCAAFLNATLGASGLQGTGSLMAKSFLNYGSTTDKPSEGDIVVLSRGDPKGPYGHVGLFAGYDENGNVKVLAGNQGNRVSVASFPAGQVIGFRKPPSAENAPPVIAAQGGPVKVASLEGQTATDASGGPIPQQTGAQTLPGGGGQVAVMADQPTGIASPGGLGQAPPQEGGQAGQPFQVAQTQRHPTVYDAMDPLAREKLLKHMHGVHDVQQVKAAKDTSEGYERALIDASAGRGPLPSREAIQNERAFNGNENIRNTLLKQYDSAAGDVVAIQNTMQRFRDGGQFNPYDKDERKNVDKIYGALGGEDPKQQAAALQSVITKTGIFPDSAAVKIRADLISNDPKRVVAGMTRASNALAGNPNILVKVDGEKDIEDNALKFRTYVDDFGMTAEEAANRLIRDQSPEYKASVNAKIKSEDVDDKIKKNLKINDLSGAFDDSFLGLATNPSVAYSVKARDKAFDQFGQLVKEYYLDTANGDWDMAKKLAANQLKKNWGVSEINGQKTLMQYPPEKAPAYQGIENATAMIAQQAQEAIKTETGVDIDRKGIRMSVVPGVTAQQYKAGQPPAYLLSWEDKSGLVHMLNPGKAFVADPKALRDAQTAQREAAITAAVETRATNPMQDMGLEAKGRNAAADTLITSARERTAADVQKRQQLRDGMVY